MLSMFRYDKTRQYFFVILLGAMLSQKVFAEPCTYESWDWDSIQRKSVHHQKIQKLKSDLSSEELGTLAGCTVCEEDQVELQIEGIPKFKVCRVFKEKIEKAIQATKASGFQFLTLVGYRVGKSKGSLNSAGLRTQFSNHSFGTAIDINAEKNGLYDFCLHFGPSCQLIRGGRYQPDSPGTISRDNEIYKQLTAAGFKWGGEINGKQKDFMHFSPTGM